MRWGSSSRLDAGLCKQIPADYVFALLGCAGVGYAVGFNWGNRGPRAFQPLVLAGLLLIWRLVALARKRGATAVTTVASELVWLPLVFLLFVMGWSAYEDPTLLYGVYAWPMGRNAQLGMCFLMLGYLPSALGVREPPWLRHLRFAVMTALVIIMGVVAIKASPAPRIDVWVLQQKAVDLLRQGRNPYQELVVNDTGWGVTMPFVYPPTVIYTGFFGKLLFGDVRYSGLVAIVMTGWAFRSIARRTRLALPALAIDAPALVFWLQPKLFMVLEQAWIDVIQLGFLSAGIAVFLGRFRLVGVIMMGVAFSSKQTMFWFLPLVFFGLGFRRRDWIALGATMALLLGPFILWDWRAIKAATTGVHVALTPRRDALAFMAWYYAKYQHWRSTAWIAWSSCLAVVALYGWRLRRSLPGFGLAAAAIYFLFFFFQKWAFANYYYFVDGLAALAAALVLESSRPETAPATTAGGTAPATATPVPPTGATPAPAATGL
jgi:hypothetical protein